MSGRIYSTAGALAAVAALVVGLVLGTHAAGGSDSSCYLNAARLLSRGTVVLSQPLAGSSQYPSLMFAPAGFTPSPGEPTAFVPICSPGLPLTMAVFEVMHLSAFLVVPLLGALCVWLTFIVGRRVDRPLTGAVAALLLVCSPTFLYQLVQPMSDVPAAAWWMLAVAWALEQEDGTNRPGCAGLAGSIAILTRPNLLPLAGVLAVYLAMSRGRNGGPRDAMRFVLGLVPGAAILALVQHAMYGSPFATGYGDAGALMATAHIVPNLRRYVWWLLGAHTPFLLLALGAPALLRRPRHAWLCLGLAAATLGCYLPYLVFDDWWYTRFLLPAIPLIVIMSVAVLVALVERVAAGLRPVARGSLVAAGSVLLMVFWVSVASARHAFELSEWEQHYYRAGTAVAAHVDGQAVVVTVKNSGSVQYYAGYPTVSWNTIEPGALERMLTFVRDEGYTPYLLIERDEEPAFRERFQGESAIGQLDWPPRLQVGRAIRLYDPADRAVYLADGKVRTRYVEDAPLPLHDWRRWVSGR